MYNLMRQPGVSSPPSLAGLGRCNVLPEEGKETRHSALGSPGLAVLAALQSPARALSGSAMSANFPQRIGATCPRSNITKLVLARSGVSREIADPQQIAALDVVIQSARYVGAHHSYPKDLVELIIESGGNSYHIQVGRDSDRPDEYWILEREGPSDPGAARSERRPDSPARPHLDPCSSQKP